MRVRVREVSASRFVGERLDAKAKEWRLVTAAKDNLLSAVADLNAFIAEEKARREFAKRVQENKHIAAEWTVEL